MKARTIRRAALLLNLGAWIALILAMCSGCTTVENFCDERPAVCATVGAAAVALAVGTVVFACAHSGPRVVHNAPPPGTPAVSCVTNPAICQ